MIIKIGGTKREYINDMSYLRSDNMYEIIYNSKSSEEYYKYHMNSKEIYIYINLENEEGNRIRIKSFFPSL